MTQHKTGFSLAATPPQLGFYETMFSYDSHVNVFVLDAIESLSGQTTSKPLARLCHVVICKQLWLARMGQAMALPDDLFPLWSAKEARQRNEETAQMMTHFLNELACNHDLCETFQYTAMEGERFESVPADILMQLLLHGSYHRGQIATELNPLLDRPLATDFLLFNRRSTCT